MKPSFRGSHILLVIGVVALAGFATSFIRQQISADIMQFTGQTHIKVLVNDKINLPIDGASVRIVAQSSQNEQTLTTKNAQGYFDTKGRTGIYTLTASAPGYISESQSVTLNATHDQEVLFYLSPQL